MNKHSKGPWKDGGRTTLPAFVDVVAPAGIVAKVWVGDNFQPDHGEGLANLRLVLNATELLAMVRELMGFRCSVGITAWCGRCEESAGCPLRAAQTLLEEIDGKEKVTMAEREAQFVWDNADPDGGRCDLWCDEEYIEQIQALEGIALVVPVHPGCKWSVTFDLRYYPLKVMDDVEAIITGQT